MSPLRVQVEFDLDAEPVRGTILARPGAVPPARPFVGWVELVSALGELQGGPGGGVGSEQTTRVAAMADRLADLTLREHEILALMATGDNNRAIERELWVSARTVESHVRSIFLKLDLDPHGTIHRRVAAVLAYLELAERRDPVHA